MNNIQTKRIYEEYSKDDGYRVLVDRIWPRGISKEKANLNDWMKEIAPSKELRKWFDHKNNRFEEFASKYKEELKKSEDLLIALRKQATKGKISLLYGAKNTEYNQAVVLKDVLMQEV